MSPPQRSIACGGDIMFWSLSSSVKCHLQLISQLNATDIRCLVYGLYSVYTDCK